MNFHCILYFNILSFDDNIIGQNGRVWFHLYIMHFHVVHIVYQVSFEGYFNITLHLELCQILNQFYICLHHCDFNDNKLFFQLIKV